MMYAERSDGGGFIELHGVELRPESLLIKEASKEEVHDYLSKQNKPINMNEFQKFLNKHNTYDKTWSIYETTYNKLLGNYSSEDTARYIMKMLKLFVTKDFHKINPGFLKTASGDCPLLTDLDNLTDDEKDKYFFQMLSERDICWR